MSIEVNLTDLESNNLTDLESDNVIDNTSLKYSEYFNNCSNVFFAAIIALIIIGAIFTLPIVIFIMANKYKNDLYCDSIISPYDWLIIEGVVVLMSSVMSILLIFSLNENTSNILKSLIIVSIFISAFNFAWLIVGSIMFWRDCLTAFPKPISILLWIILMISWVQIYINLKKNE